MKFEKIYKRKVKKILKTYDCILVKSKNIPRLTDRNIIVTDSIENVVDAQMEIRKPIYYFDEIKSCSFILLEDKEAIVYIIKETETTENVVEKLIEVIQAELLEKENEKVAEIIENYKEQESTEGKHSLALVKEKK